MARKKGPQARAHIRRRVHQDGPASSGAAGRPVSSSGGEAQRPGVVRVASLDFGWCPPFRTAFMFLLAVRVWGAVVNTISDCDEVYNYWEPTHQMLFGRGFQTWEYSPEFALRSYLYTGLHAAMGRVASFILAAGSQKFAMFYAIRLMLAVTCAFSEALMYESVTKACSKRIGVFFLCFLALSAGMFHSSSAYLPSSFAMYAVMWAYSAWLNGRVDLTMLAGCLGVLIGWPFSGVVFVPLGLDMMARGALFGVIRWGITWSAAVLGVSMLVDKFYYHRWLIPVWNIVKYNALGGGGGDGSQLYGTEPASFYVKNLLLNFNLVFLLALLSSVLVMFDKQFGGRLRRGASVASVAPFWTWFLWMSAQPHKEERFMFVVYPVIALAAAMALASVARCLRFLGKTVGIRLSTLSRCMVFGTIGLSAVLSASRCVALVSNYGAPMQAFARFAAFEVPELEARSDPVLVCVGKEWYRFPSSFFLPDAPVEAHLGFLRSSFGGQLPQPYAAVNATWTVQPGFNDLNEEDPSRYVEVADCDYIVDLELEGQVEPRYAQDEEWEKLWSAPFLDASRSPSLSRAFYAPWLVERNTYGEYQLLRRRRSA